MPAQFPLQFEFQSNQNFNTFYSGNNGEIINHLKHFETDNEQQIFLWGETGTGKTHLLQAMTQQAYYKNKSSFYFAFEEDNLPPIGILYGLENLSLVCFDNIDHIVGNSLWEQAFFNFYNRHRDNNKQLVLSATCPPSELNIQLPDLNTRMSWGLTLKLQLLIDEQQLINALIYKANALGFEMPINVSRFLMKHYTHDLPSIWVLLDRIDQETLAAKRKLTIPFLKKIINHQDNYETV